MSPRDLAAVLVIVGERRLVRRLVAGALFGLLVVATGLAFAGDEALAVIEVDVDSFELTVDLRHVPLRDVLRLIGERAGVEVTLYGDGDVLVTDSFARLLLEDGIRRLARGHSVTATYAVSTEVPARNVVTGIWVSGRATAADSARASAVIPGSPSISFDGARAEGDAPVSVAADPLVAWIGEIRSLVGEVGRGNEAAAARLADVSGSEPDVRVREQAVAALGRIKDPLVEPALTVALGDGEAAVRTRAVRGLRGVGTDTAIASLAAASTGDADPEVRLAALNALMSFPGHTMAQGLVRAVADPDGRVRDAAARALAWWGSVRRSGAP